jgi:protein-disulfide isomerase
MQTNNNFEPTSHETAKKQSAFRVIIWLLLVMVLGLGVLGGFYLRPLLTPEVKADAVSANVVEPVTIPDNNVANETADSRENLGAHEAIMQTVVANARHFDGDPNAPITLVEFADFNCGYCGKWAQETLPQIRQNYVDNGKVQIAYVNYPVLGSSSVAAAQASECAAQQDKFWEYHNALYENQSTGFTTDALINLAGEVGMDTATFEQCVVDFPKGLLENDMLLGQAMGVRGTPAFLINGIAVPGALPYEQFEQVIESLLAKS